MLIYKLFIYVYVRNISFINKNRLIRGKIYDLTLAPGFFY